VKFEKFEEIIAWQKAKELAIHVYSIFENSKDFGLKDQIQRASVSVMNNIAEGYERKSNKEFKYFLFVSKGSCGEVRSMLHLLNDLEKIDRNEYEKLLKLSTEISMIISGLIQKL